MIAAAIVAALAIAAWWFWVRPKMRDAYAQIAAQQSQIVNDENMLATLWDQAKAYDAAVLAFGARQQWEQDVRVATGVAK